MPKVEDEYKRRLRAIRGRGGKEAAQRFRERRAYRGKVGQAVKGMAGDMNRPGVKREWASSLSGEQVAEKQAASDRKQAEAGQRLASLYGRKAQQLAPGNITPEAKLEMGFRPAQVAGRQQQLTRSLQQRTTDTSRARALNRILALRGQTSGATGTYINPKKTLARGRSRRPVVS